ncbi:MAG: glycosyltransferase family 4 protein [Anaerolineae bacterium]
MSIAQPTPTRVTEPDPSVGGGGASPDRRYKVLMIAPTSFFLDYGCHVRILEEALILQKMGHAVTICTYHHGRDLGGLTIERTVPIPWWRGYEGGSSLRKIALDALLSLKSLAVAWREKPDVIHGHLHEGAFIGYPLSLLWRVPLVFDFQGSLTSEMVDHRFLRPDGFFYSPLRRLEEIINRLPRAIITSSYHAADLCLREFGCHPQRVYTVPDCVNAEVFRPGLLGEEERAALKARLGIPTECKVVVYLGLLAEYQGTGLLLQAAAHLVTSRPDVHFLIMGWPSEDCYRLMARQLGVAEHTTFTGKIPYEEAPRYLALGDIAVAPKISATEGSGKLLNYMAMALPTAAFATNVSREYLGDYGVYAEVGNPVALAEAMGSLLADEAMATELGQRLRERAVQKYSWERAGERILEVYDLACGRGGR